MSKTSKMTEEIREYAAYFAKDKNLGAKNPLTVEAIEAYLDIKNSPVVDSQEEFEKIFWDCFNRYLGEFDSEQECKEEIKRVTGILYEKLPEDIKSILPKREVVENDLIHPEFVSKDGHYFSVLDEIDAGDTKPQR